MSERPTVPEDTKRQQRIASDPMISAWVSANAGSGKTYVLTRRVIRLLLAGVEPSRILCLTFTKAAAAEMSNRVFETLGQWVALDDAALAQELRELTPGDPTHADMRRARTLFALSLDSPGGLKIQTIHAFCEALLHQFPLEANVSGHFTVIEDALRESLIAEARRQVILEMETGEGRAAGLRHAFGRLLALASDTAIENGLRELIGKREAFLDWAGADVSGAMQPLWHAQGMTPGIKEEDVIAQGLAQTGFSDGELALLASAAQSSASKTDRESAARLAAFVQANDPRQRFRFRKAMFLTKDLEKRKNIFTKAVTDANPGLKERLERETEHVFSQLKASEAWRVLASSQALFEVGEAILERYLSLKRRRGLADFDDLISLAGKLLTRSDVRQWVQYKLDKGIDHVLVDEAQDTSPRQWQIINALVEDFHAGASASNRVRTVFAVGDEKQSIYSFQGADPKKFSEEAASLKLRAANAGKAFSQVPLQLSFRSVPDVLLAVDLVFADADNFKGLSRTETATVHEALRRRDPGEVQVWPLCGMEKAPEPDSWLEPLDHAREDHPAEVLAERIAITIKDWISSGAKLPGRDRPILCGDILILVRKRDLFSTAIIRRLKEQQLAIAGADRLKLTEHIAIEDLIALGRVMLMPQDDLSLASVLKSPLFGLDDDELIAIATNRDGEPLFDHLDHVANGEGALAKRIAEIKSRLLDWQALAQRSNPYGFYAHVLGRGGGRRAFASRLGTEAEDVLDAFEQAALDHPANGGKGLEDFIASLVRASPEIKREIDMRENEIRVITVHSAKGLEAPIVFLVDPCTPAYNASHRPAILSPELAGEQQFIWANGPRDRMAAIIGEDARIKEEAEEEYRRLLYVGMTRAADRLIVCGWHKLRKPAPPHWHSMVAQALLPGSEEVDTGAGWSYHCWKSTRPDVVDARREVPLKPVEAAEETMAADLPGWLSAPVPREPPVPRPLTPSGAAALLSPLPLIEPDEVPLDAAMLADMDARRQFALERGTLTHRLLQHLPDVEPSARREIAEAIMAREAAHWQQDERLAALAEVFTLLEARENAVLFGPDSRAEVNVAGNVRIGARQVLVSGQIDRLAVTSGAVEIADYKTNRNIPADPRDAPQAYVLQLALYRELLRQIYPGHPVTCRLIWTRNGTASPISDAAMDAAIAAMTIE